MTNRPLAQLREDLVARFAFQVELPALAGRREDVPLLVRHLLDQVVRADPELARRFLADGAVRIKPRLLMALLSVDLPTNVRQLRNLLLASLAESADDLLGVPVALAATVGGRVPAPTSSAPPSDPTALDPSRVQSVLDAHNGRLEPSRVALGLPSRHSLSRLIKRHGLVISKRPG